MGQASYNAGNVDLRGSIVPCAGMELDFGCVKTTEHQAPIARRVYVFPGLSGMGSEYCGVRAQQIDWDLTVVASSAANLQIFLNRFTEYIAGGRYELVSELGGGRYWPYVELAAVVPLEETPLIGGQFPPVLWHGRIEWANMQPRSGAG